MPKMPPMYKQYKALKAAHPKALLFYRLGDFYELFEEDAKIGARELGLTLTQRSFSKDIRLPMAGVPHRHVDGYINRLINKGYMVAVADQLEDSRQAKGLVKRGVVRVVTSGTVMDQPLLKENADNFLMALAPTAGETGLAYLDLSTGEFTCTCLQPTDLLEEIARVHPSEVILPPTLKNDADFCQSLAELGVARLSPLEETVFVPEVAQDQLKAHFKVATLEAYSDHPLALTAAGIILHYLKINQLSELAHITSLTTYHQSDYMALDTITRRNLELTQTLREGHIKGTLVTTLDETKTRMGARLLRRWINHPLNDLAKIQARLDAVGILVKDAFLRHDLREVLRGMYDLERLAGRVGYGNANGRDLVNLKATLARIPTIKSRLETTNALTESSLLVGLHSQLNPLTDIVNLIERSLVDEPPILLTEGGLIKPSFHPELESLRQTALDNRNWITNYEAMERECTGIKNLRIKYNQVFGFFIEVTKSNLSRVPETYQRRATTTNSERFITPELKAHEADILAAEDAAHGLEYDLFLDIRCQVAAHLPALRQTAQALAQLDVLLALAELAALHNYIKPTLTSDPVLSLREARHPVVERMLEGDVPFVPNGCELDDKQRLIVLTGPNMSGKSVYLRQTALAVLMAQIGSFVAASAAHIGLADRIFARAGASDDISQGRSTFLVEMSETAHILHHATQRSLIILDEVGRGTSTYDGLSLAWAVAEDIHCNIQARCLFATHFHELTALGETFPGVGNYSLAVREQDGQVIFLRRLIPGGADKSYGIYVARLAGLPRRILKKAEAILASLERDQANELITELYQESEPPTRAMAEQTTSYDIEPSANTDDLILPANDAQASDDVHIWDSDQLWDIIREMYRLDIANMTPIEALIQLNTWQQQLKREK